MIPQQGEVQVVPDPDKTGRDEYFNKLIIAEATEADGGTYYCFVKSAIGYKFKSAYLTVVPSKCLKSVLPNHSNAYRCLLVHKAYIKWTKERKKERKKESKNERYKDIKKNERKKERKKETTKVAKM